MNEHPDHISTEDLLAVVEGALPAERREAVRAALAADPVLARQLIEMRADREALKATGIVAAPATLVASALAVVERTALLGEATDPADLPVSMLQPRRAGVLARIGRSSWTPRIAMAAGLALVVGAGAWMANLLLTPGSRTPTGNGASLALGGGSSESPITTEPFGPPDTLRSAPTSLALSEPAPLHGPEPTAALAAARMIGGMSEEHALELVREGRLGVRVLVESEAAGIRLVEASRAARTGSTGVWSRVDERHSPVQLAHLTSTWAGMTHLELPNRETSPKVYAADKTPKTVAPASAETPARTIARAFYVVDLVSVNPDLEGLAASLGEGAVFVELPAPLPAPTRPDAASIVWWTGPSSRWVTRTSVPVAIEVAP